MVSLESLIAELRRPQRAVATRRTLAACAAAALAACAQIPQQPLVQQPMTAMPPPRPIVAQSTGSIYTGYSDHPLFEDSRPRNVGDILTIVIAENINATKSSGSSASRAGSETFTPTAMPGIVGGLFNHSATSVTGDNTFQATGGAAAQNTFSGTLTVTVTQVLANGNLMVSGEKQMLINQGNEYIRFSGVVNPTTVSGTNTVESYQVADAKIEYSAKGYINEAETMGWLQRFFLNIAPF
ncbi:flagellar basal body L-ring protein FlgH [Pararobbsia silviterrae]|uniref:Flagellar L-ring protein n=1 Tax=Pararobbsia silviterrae TaxID=1792498 RepID=A0A494XB78_9BURK|nr:flagellar basal body L-ring protein FlgH [Pararobbsia silviterrae]RKP45359.1 flagellar basal body L-ring protein FlgH [Pararobbsia silviterrae]